MKGGASVADRKVALHLKPRFNEDTARIWCGETIGYNWERAMRTKLWYSLSLAAVIAIAVFITGNFNDPPRHQPIEPSTSTSSSAQQSAAAVDATAALSETISPEPTDQIQDVPIPDQQGQSQQDQDQQQQTRQGITAELEQPATKTRTGLAPATYQMALKPIAGTNDTAQPQGGQ